MKAGPGVYPVLVQGARVHAATPGGSACTVLQYIGAGIHGGVVQQVQSYNI